MNEEINPMVRIADALESIAMDIKKIANPPIILSKDGKITYIEQA